MPSAPTLSSAPTEKNKQKMHKKNGNNMPKQNATALEHAKTIFLLSLSSSDSNLDHSDIELEGEHELKSAGRIAMQSKVALYLSVGKSKNNMWRAQLNQQQELIVSLQEQLHESKHAQCMHL